MNLTEILNKRYSTKDFDPDKKISTADFEQIKHLLRMSPSSTNLQPWHFIVADTEEGKQRLNKATEGNFEFNKLRIAKASHVVILCARTKLDEIYMQHLIEQETTDGRMNKPEIKQLIYNARNTFTNIHKYELKDQQHWVEKQVYLNMGTLLLGAALLGIDALPMEGIDCKAIDQEFNLREKGFTAIAAVSLGYRTETDFNAPDKTPKSRLALEEIITIA